MRRRHRGGGARPRPAHAARRPGSTLVLLGSLLVLAAIYAGLAWVVGRHLPARTVVAGVNVGGMAPDDAAERVQRKLGATLDEPISLDLASTVVQVRPSELGLALDLQSTMRDATGLSLDPRQVWWRLNGGGDVPLRTTIDTAVAAQALSTTIAAVDRPVVEPVVTFGPAVQVVRPREGRRVALAATLDRVRAQWPASTRIVGLVERIPPAVTAAEVDRVVAATARPAVATPLSVVLGGTRTVLDPPRFAPALRMVVDGRSLALRVDAPALAGILREHVSGLETEPVDATVRLAAGRPEIVEAAPGRTLGERDTAAAVLAALLARSGTSGAGEGAAPGEAGRAVGIVTKPVPATVTTAEVRAWRVERRLAQVELPVVVAGVPGAAAARSNVEQATAILHDQLLGPGETLSMSQLVGNPAGRYADAAELEAGGVVERPGGGLSQLASALYAAGWHAGLDVGPRRAHPVYLPDYPPGLDAVYSWPDADVALRNPGPGPVLVGAQVSDGRLTVALWGRADTVVATQIGERRDVVEPGPWAGNGPGCLDEALSAPGFDLDASRRVTRGRTVLPVESIASHYDPLHAAACA